MTPYGIDKGMTVWTIIHLSRIVTSAHLISQLGDQDLDYFHELIFVDELARTGPADRSNLVENSSVSGAEAVESCGALLRTRLENQIPQL